MSEPVIDKDLRCWRCKALLSDQEVRPWHIRCERCRAFNGSPPWRNMPETVVDWLKYQLEALTK